MKEEEKNTIGTSPAGRISAWRQWLLSFVYRHQIGEKQATYVWAILIGMAGACSSLCFEWIVEGIQWLLTGIWSESRVETFAALPYWHRLLVPAVGGLIAGCVLLFLDKRMPGQAMEYLEALAIGNGRIPVRASSLKTSSAAWSIASGAAIGKEGPIIQSAALLASAIGQKIGFSMPRLRLMVGCGAAAGFTTAFHAPFSGCLFVSEIIMGAVSMDILAPLLLASCSGFLVLNFLGSTEPLYRSSFESFASFDKMLWCIVLGVVAAVAAKCWVGALGWFSRILNGRDTYLPLRLMLAGIFVGILACFYPEVVGNGQFLLTGLVNDQYSWQEAFVLTVVKIGAVLVVFGCGTVGGAMTPTLFAGSMVGFLFGTIVDFWGGNNAVAYALVGMSAFFATSAKAPLTALLMAVEFSQNGAMIYPLAIGVVSAYGTAHLIHASSMYADSLKGGIVDVANRGESEIRAIDLARPHAPQVGVTTSVKELVDVMIAHPGQPVFVVGSSGEYLGCVTEKEIMTHDTEADSQLTAGVLMNRSFPIVDAEATLPRALEIVEQSHEDALPVVEQASGRLAGILYCEALSQVMRKRLEDAQVS